MAGIFQVPRSRGVLSGALLVALGIWGALLPMVGPYFDFAYGPDLVWHMTMGRLLLQVVPGILVFLGGLILLFSANRAVATAGGWVAAVGGAWFVVGTPLSALWGGSVHLGAPLGGTALHAWENFGLLSGLGAVIVFLAALALGRFAVVGVRERRMTERGPHRGKGAVPTPRKSTSESDEHARTTEEGSRHRPGAGT